MTIDPTRQYLQSDLPSEVFNAGNGDTVNYNGTAVKVGVNGNGTRSLTSLGDWTTYNNQQAATSAENQATTNFNNLVSSNTGAVTDFLGNYKTDTSNAIANANTTFNLPQQTNLVEGLNSRIADLTNNSDNSGAGGFSSSGQVDAALNSRYIPQLTAAEGNLNTSETAAQNQENIALAPDQANASLLANNITAAMNGLTATQQSVLQSVIGQLNAGVSLTNTQLTTAESLAQAVLSNANNITLQNMKNQYTPIPSGNTTINPSSGQIVNPYLLATQNGGVYTP
jgi:hypothetical protein